NVTRSVTPARTALARALVMRSGSRSTPTARAPRSAAAMTLSPSPHPRSYTTSPGPTAAASSMTAMTSGALGTHTASRCGGPRHARRGRVTGGEGERDEEAAHGRPLHGLPSIRSGQPAVGRQHLTRHVAGAVGADECDERRDLVRRPRSRERDRAEQLGADL